MADGGMAENVFPDGPARVPLPYGGFQLEAMDAHGGWLGSILDLARFARALERTERSGILTANSLRQMYEPPPPPLGHEPDGSVAQRYYASGWGVVRGHGNHVTYYHNGSLPGTYTLLVRRGDGVTFIALFNQRSDDPKDPDSAVEIALHRAMDSIKEWPEIDLFRKNAG